MSKIFLKDVISVANQRGRTAGNVFYYVIIPELSKNENILILDNETEYSIIDDGAYDITIRNYYRYRIDNKFPEDLNEEDIKHSFHKGKVKIFDKDNKQLESKIDAYFTNRMRKFKREQT